VTPERLRRVLTRLDRWLDVVYWQCDRGVEYFRMPRRLRGLSDEQLAPMREDFAIHGADPRFLAAMSDVVKAARRAKLHDLAMELDQMIIVTRLRERRRLQRLSPPPRAARPERRPLLVPMPTRRESRPGRRVRATAAAGGDDPPDADRPGAELDRARRGRLGLPESGARP
jgi:hypothetical protein